MPVAEGDGHGVNLVWFITELVEAETPSEFKSENTLEGVKHVSNLSEALLSLPKLKRGVEQSGAQSKTSCGVKLMPGFDPKIPFQANLKSR